MSKAKPESREFCVENEDWTFSDADIHEPILAGRSEEDALRAKLHAARGYMALGLTEAEVRLLYALPDDIEL